MNFDIMTTTAEWDAAIKAAHARGVREGLERALDAIRESDTREPEQATERIRALLDALPKEGA